MNKKILFLFFCAISLFPLVGLAQLHGYGNTNLSIDTFMSNILNATALIFSGVAVICFVIAGIMFLTAQGDASKLQAARSAFIWGIAGVVVGIIAFSIIKIVGSFLG